MVKRDSSSRKLASAITPRFSSRSEAAGVAPDQQQIVEKLGNISSMVQ